MIPEEAHAPRLREDGCCVGVDNVSAAATADADGTVAAAAAKNSTR